MNKDSKKIVSAEQYLILNYEQALSDNDELKLENETLKEKLKAFEQSPEDAENKLKVLPVLKVTYRENLEYKYHDYDLTPDKYDELVSHLKVLEDNPKHALIKNTIAYVTSSESNVKVEIYGLEKYGRAYLNYNDNNKLDLFFYNEIVSFEEAYEKLIKEINKSIAGWNKTYKQKYLDKLEKEQ